MPSQPYIWYRDTTTVVILDFVLLAGLVVAARVWQKSHGLLGAKRTAIFMCSYWTFFYISNLWRVLEINFSGGILVMAILVGVTWLAGYPWVRWLYEKFASR